jgi:hypothetical protein
MTSKLESYLSDKLYTRFGQFSIRQNYRPDWLNGLELDFYIDELKLAAEVQGDQHFSFVSFFHKTEDGFKQQKQRDAEKSLICFQNGIMLKEIFTEKDADLFIIFIQEKINQPRIQLPSLLRIQKNNSKHLKGQIKGYNKCVKNLFFYENGFMEADEKSVRMWKKTIQRGVLIKGVRRG